MPSVQNIIVEKAVKAAFKQSAKSSVRGTMRLLDRGTTSATRDSAAKFTGAVFDIGWDAIKNGNVSRGTLVRAILQESVALAGLSENEKTQCLGALLDVGYYSAELTAGIAFVTGEEFATAGLATPVVIAQSALMAKSTYDLVNASIKANQLCGPLAVRGYKSLTSEWGALVVRGEAAFKEAARDLDMNVTKTVMGNGF